MNTITIDNGNTNSQVGIFNEESKLNSIISYNDFLNNYNPKQYTAIYSNVGKTLYKIDSFKKLIKIKSLLKNNKFLGMNVPYSNTIGEDRLSISYYCWKKLLFKEEPIIVIDAGTFTTIDLVSKKGLVGGLITPSLHNIYNIYNKGHLLPKSINYNIKSTNIATDTESSINNAVTLLISVTYKEIIKKYSPSKIIITGGDSKRHIKLLEKITSIKIENIKYLIHYSLYNIYRETTK